MREPTTAGQIFVLLTMPLRIVAMIAAAIFGGLRDV